MIENIGAREDLASLARRRRMVDLFKSVRSSSLEKEVDSGWEVVKHGKTSVRLSKPKPHDTLLTDRVWTLFYKFGFPQLSGESAAILRKGDTASEIGVLAFDNEVAILGWSRSFSAPQKLPSLRADIDALASLRPVLSMELRKLSESGSKHSIALAIFTSGVMLTDRDFAAAKENGVSLFDDRDLSYYEDLEEQLGPAAKYQLLADVLPGKQIAGLEITVPTVKARMGMYDCYTFPISPDYLLKVAYVSHRAKGKPSDVDTYQRMIKRSRLRKIRSYISEDGIFPTNIVVNIDPKWVRFDRAKQETVMGPATFGWLRLRPAYKVAWIIDGQHRLYAFSGHPRAATSIISVLAFVGLPASEQARLFVDINAEQRKVKQNLLYELYAELHWDSDNPEVRTRAVLSKAIQALDTELGSPFYQRILKADDYRTATRCISLTTIFRAMEKTGFYFSKQKRSEYEIGPLLARDNNSTLRRTIVVLRSWFDCISRECPSIWDLGSGEGGGLAMNEGVTICINVLRSVFLHLESWGKDLAKLGNEELAAAVEPFGSALGQYFALMSGQELRNFRALRGNQGQTTGTRRAQQAITKSMPEFDPPGLMEFLEREKAQTNERAAGAIFRIEALIQRTVVGEIKAEYGEGEAGWWFEGVPKQVRKKVDDRINEDQGKRGGREQNFDLIDYRDVISHNWPLFESVFGFGKGNKEARTKWLASINEIRKTAMHASRGVHLPVREEQLAFLEEIESELRERVSGGNQIDEGGESADLVG